MVAARRAVVELDAQTRALVAVDALSMQRSAPLVAPRRIGAALEVWKRASTRPEKTVAAFTRHANQFAALMRDPDLVSLRKVDAMRFRNQLKGLR